jgi:nitrogen fixation protein FixH
MKEPLSDTDSSPYKPQSRIRWDGLVLTMAGIFLMVIAVNLVMLWMTLYKPVQLVSSSYYDDARHFSDPGREERSKDALGWKVALVPDSTSRGQIVVLIQDGSNRPMGGVTGQVHIYRPSDSALDQDATLLPLNGKSGHYGAALLRPAPGRWQLTIRVSRGEARAVERLDWVAP